MSDESQIHLPESFLALFQTPGKTKPSASRAHVIERYEWCEDMAQLLTEPAREQMFRMGITEEDVVHSLRPGLSDVATGLSEPEADWVAKRLRELLQGH